MKDWASGSRTNVTNLESITIRTWASRGWEGIASKSSTKLDSSGVFDRKEYRGMRGSTCVLWYTVPTVSYSILYILQLLIRSSFQALERFKEEHGHCRVPITIPDLGKWAKYQRDQYSLFMRGKKAKINQEKIDRLLSIGFEDSLEERVTLGLNCQEEEVLGIEMRMGMGHNEGGVGVAVGVHHHNHHQIAKEMTSHHHAPPHQEGAVDVGMAYHHHQLHAEQQHHSVVATAGQPAAMVEHAHAVPAGQPQEYPLEQYHHREPAPPPPPALQHHSYETVQHQGSGTTTYHYQHGGAHYTRELI